MPEKRIRILLIFFTVIIGLIGWRLFYLQIISGSQLASKAAYQKTSMVEIANNRGEIFDKNLIPLVNRSEVVRAVIMPLVVRGDKETFDEIVEILQIDSEKLKEQIDSSDAPIVISINNEQISALGNRPIKGVSLVHALKRYDEDTLAKHIIGYISQTDKNGQMGIEKKYDNILHRNGGDSVAVIADAAHKTIYGLGYRVIGNTKSAEGLNVRLTLNYLVQKQVENIMEDGEITGAVIVEDIRTGDILAMASKPDFDPNAVEHFLHSDKNELFNRAVAGYDFGSIFKIVITAAALEDNYFNRFNKYFCSGSANVDGKAFNCTSIDSGGHGLVDLDKAFSVSCNPAFIQTGLKIGPQAIFSMAKRLGFGIKTGVNEQGIDEAAGNIPVKKYYSKREIANISIGQGEILTTPLQVVDMISTIANGGIRNKINIVDALVDSQGKPVQTIRQSGSQKIIARNIADDIKGMMEEVTLTGTGKKAAVPAELGGSAGKTGSAETGIFVEGEKVVHAWFGGYFPVQNPRYAIVVFAENGKYGGESAAPIFKKVAEAMIEMGL